MRIALIMGFVFVFGLDTYEVRGQDRKDIESALEGMYQLSKIAFFDPSKINVPGGVYVVLVDGIQGEVMLQSGTALTHIVDGKLQATSDSGAGTLFTSIVSGSRREDARILKKGELVYVTGFNAARDGLRMDLATVETFPIVDQGRTRQVAYKAALFFRTAEKKFPNISDAALMKQLIDSYIASESDMAAPKTIALGQSLEEVEQVLGKPLTIAYLGEKTIYTYKELKIVFVNGKVTDVQ